MTNKFATYTAIAALALTPAAAFAQSATPPATETPSAAPSTPPAASSSTPLQTPAPASSMTGGFISEQTIDQSLSSDIIGASVVSSTDESLGKVSYLVLNKDGTVAAAVIGVGGFLGVGTKDVAVPFTELTMAPTEDGEKIVLNKSKDELNQAPEFKTAEAARQAQADTAAPKTQ